MNDLLKTKQELIEEISVLRRRVEELESSGDRLSRREEDQTSSRQQLQLLIDAGPDFFFLKDLDLRYQLVNAANARFLGRRKEDVLGRTDDELMPADAAKACRDSDMTAIRGKRTVITVEPVGEKFYEAYKFPVFDEDEIVGVAGIIRDITERMRVEEALRESEERWQFALEGAGDGVWDWNARTNKVFFSRQWKAMLGYAEDEITNAYDEWDRRIHPDDRGRVREKLGRHLEGKSAVYFCEHRVKCKDGTYKWILDRGKVIGRTPEGKPLRVIGTHSDITHRKRAEEAVLESEERFRTIFQSSRDAIMMMGPDGAVSYWNPAAERIFGYASTEAIGRNLHELLAPERYWDVHRSAYEEFLHTGRGAALGQALELQAVRKDGTEIIVALSLTAERIKDRWHAIGILRDITEQKKAEEALRRSESRLSGIIEFLPDATLAIDLEGKIITWNKAIEDMTGFHAETMLGKGDHEYALPFYGERRPMLVDFVFLWNEEFAGKYSYIKKEGDTLYIETDKTSVRGRSTILRAKASPLRDERGNIIGAIESVRDITAYKRAEKALKERERTLQAFFDAVHESMLLINEERIVILCNTVAAQRLGKAVPELVGTCLYDDLPPDVAQYRKEQHDKVFATGSPVSFEDTRAGRNFEQYCYPVFDGDGKVSGLTIFARDITERKSWLEALEESEERYRTVVEDSRDGIAIVNEGVHIYVNQRFLDIFGFRSIDEVIGKPHSLTVHPDDLERVIEINRQRQNGESVPSTYSFKGIRKDGSVLFVEVSATRIMYKGSYDSLVFLRDITDRKQAEDALRKSEQTLQAERDKLQTISENAPFGLVLIDKAGRFTYVNPKFVELFGFDPTDIPDGRAWLRKAYPDTEYRHTVISTWMEDQGHPGRRTLKPRIFNVACKDGTHKIVSFVSSVLASGDYLMACEDITDLKHLESQLRQAQKMEAIGTLAGGIAHDFNNILTAIIGYGSLLQMNMDDANPLKLYVDPIISATRKATDLTQNLLAFSRQQPVTLVPLNINDEITTTKKLINRLLTEDIELRTSFTKDDTIVLADKTLMDQILFNLVTNARDAMPKGGRITIETETVTLSGEFIRIHGFGQQGKYVQIKVSDTGTGMDEATRESIFDPFFTTKEVGKGTGLGLATVYGIVKQHGGYITVDSKPNRGSVFRIYLPVVKAVVDREDSEETSVKGGNERILIAEDNEGVRRYMRDLLRQYGYKTIEAIDGQDAIHKFRQNQNSDLIIVDSVMPKKNGREVYEEIRRIQPEIRVLFTSGYTRDVVLDKGIEDREFDFIPKPLSPATFLRKVREVLDRESNPCSAISS